MMILETVLSDRYVCQISCFSPQVKYLGDFFMLAATLLIGLTKTQVFVWTCKLRKTLLKLLFCTHFLQKTHKLNGDYLKLHRINLIVIVGL